MQIQLSIETGSASSEFIKASERNLSGKLSTFIKPFHGVSIGTDLAAHFAKVLRNFGCHAVCLCLPNFALPHHRQT